ncbi:hypothetical protein B7P43_G01782 [Cryptotermes secundus]|nr:hypothetical protein B7P43_G01782 [Cryptotermes secundus]
MIGHYAVKNSSEYSESPHIVDIECFLYKPYPAVIQVRADFSIHNVCHMCTLEPLSLDLPDFFQPLPVHDEFISASVVWRRALFHSLWNSLEEESLTVSNAAFTSVCVLQQSREDLRAKLYEELHECIVEENKDFFHVGIYLFPTSHLLMKFLFKCGSTLVRIVTDDVNILAHVNSYFKTWL